MKTIAQSFAEHCRTVYPPELLATMGDANLEELRRTFFIGFNACMQRVTAITGSMSEGEAVQAISEINLELSNFIHSLKGPPEPRNPSEEKDRMIEPDRLFVDLAGVQRDAQIDASKIPKLTHNGWPTGADLPNTFPKHIDADGNAHY